jgi:hypothetical protein
MKSYVLCSLLIFALGSCKSTGNLAGSETEGTNSATGWHKPKMDDAVISCVKRVTTTDTAQVVVTYFKDEEKIEFYQQMVAIDAKPAPKQFRKEIRYPNYNWLEISYVTSTSKFVNKIAPSTTTLTFRLTEATAREERRDIWANEDYVDIVYEKCAGFDNDAKLKENRANWLKSTNYFQ